MVKGNWERRAELATQRKLEGKQKKEERKSTPSGGRNKCESAYNRIMKDENLLQSDIDPSYPLIWAWLESEEETFVCSEWFRFESCKAGKKCKLSHPINTVSHLLFERKEETSNKERSCNEPVPLRSISRGQINRIRFIAVAKECLFDYTNSLVWEVWQSKRAVNVKGDKEDIPQSQGPLETIVEHDDDERCEENRTQPSTATTKTDGLQDITSSFSTHTLLDNSKSNERYSSNGIESSKPRSVLHSLTLSTKLTVLMLSYLVNNDFMRFFQCSKAIRKCCLNYGTIDFDGTNGISHADSLSKVIRLRYKEILNTNTSRMKEVMSKQKKQEKKKKSKQAHVKNQGKKDGFARGGNCA